MMKRSGYGVLGLLIKLLLSIAFIFLIAKSVDFSSLISVRERLSYPYLALFMLISWPMIWASCVKWRLFLVQNSNKLPILFLMKIYLISYFANLFLPSTLGGDAVRSFHLGKKISNQADAFTATFFERLTGIFTLLLVSIFGLVFSNYKNPYFLFTTIGLFVSITVVFILIFSNSGQSLFNLVRSRIPHTKIGDKIFNVISNPQITKFCEPIFLMKTVFWSLVFYFLTILNTYLGILSISVSNISIIDLAFVVPLVLLLTSMPITPGGIGVQEGAFVFFLSYIGLSTSEALFVALLLRLKVIFLAILGWIAYLSTKRISKVEV